MRLTLEPANGSRLVPEGALPEGESPGVHFAGIPRCTGQAGGWRDETRSRNGGNPKPRKSQFSGENPARLPRLSRMILAGHALCGVRVHPRMKAGLHFSGNEQSCSLERRVGQHRFCH
jgi:hypothetical protein